jgi:hypothetical protein
MTAINQARREQALRHAALSVLEVSDATGEPITVVARRLVPRPEDIQPVIDQAEKFDQEIDRQIRDAEA